MAEKMEQPKIGKYAINLALTEVMADEISLKEEYRKQGLKFAVTEVGGKADSDLHIKITNAVIGAALNNKVIQKTPHDMHALLHATEEAKIGIFHNNNLSTNLALKIAIMCSENWLAVAIYGESSMHTYTSHERCGLGIMHI